MSMAGPRSKVRVAVTALRRSREALVELDGHLDEALDWVHDPSRPLDAHLPDRLARSARRAGEALSAVPVLGEYPASALF
jgi:hypothetical protein